MELKRVGDDYQVNTANQIVFLFSNIYLSRQDNQLRGSMKMFIPNKELPVFRDQFSLSSSRSRSSTAKTLAEIVRNSQGKLQEKAYWDNMLFEVCGLVEDAWRQPAEVIDLATVELDNSPRWLLKPYIERGNITTIFSRGDSLKSVLALAMGTSIATGISIIGDPLPTPSPVIYLDWEDNQQTHARRLQALCKGHDLPLTPHIKYIKMRNSLKNDIRYIKETVDRLQAELIIIDSLGISTGGDPSNTEATMNSLSSALSLGVSVLIVHHITRESIKEGNLVAYGSTYIDNESRVMFALSKAKEAEAFQPVVGVYPKKANNGPPSVEYQHHALKLNFINEEAPNGDYVLDKIEISQQIMDAYPSLMEHVL